MRVNLGISSAYALRDDELDDIVGSVQRDLPKPFQTTPEIWVSENRLGAVLSWPHRRLTKPASIYVDDGLVCAIGGYTVADPDDQAFRGKIAAGENVDFISPVGGIYSAIFLDRKTGAIHGAQSRSGIEPLFYVKERIRVFLSNRPLVASDASGHPAVLDKSDPVGLTEGAFPINGGTALLNVHRLAVRRAVTALRGAATFRNRHVPEVDHPKNADVVERAEYLCDLLRAACAPLRKLNTRLRISGGKDSWILAALFHNMGLKVDYETHGDEGSEEGRGASPITKIASGDIPSIYPMRASVNYLDGDFQRLFRVRGGSLFSVPLHYLFEMMTEADGYEAAVLGHAHQLRGGFARTMSSSWDHVEDRLRGSFSGPIFAKGFRTSDAFVTDFVRKGKDKHPLVTLYRAYDENSCA